MSRETKAAIMHGVEFAGKPKLIAPNTVKYTKPNGDICIRFHHTDIITTHKDGSITLTTGGWKTKTIKERLNAIGGYRIGADKGIWWISGVPFKDGMRIKSNGKIENLKQLQKQMQDDLLLTKRINKYLRPILTMPELPKPSSGDCWNCLMNMPDNGEHLRQHIKENYIHGSLIVNALEWAGYNKVAIASFLCSTHGRTTLRKTVQSSMRRYLKRQLGLAS